MGSTEAVLLADAADTIVTITANTKPIAYTLAGDKKSVTLNGANFLALTASAGTKDLVVEYPDSVKIPVTLDVVTGKIETVAKP